MTMMKEMQFPVSVRWRGGRLARAEGHDKEPFELATPPSSAAVSPATGAPKTCWSPQRHPALF